MFVYTGVSSLSGFFKAKNLSPGGKFGTFTLDLSPGGQTCPKEVI